ncbi:MAG: hypothetical protein JEZ06_00470 [Anaerolineaceae bacterium]|nr:hypothetical protein [Anaerolineaceae bacterium]
MTKVELVGDKELKHKLDLLGRRARAALLQATRAGAEPIRAQANSMAPSPHVEMSEVKLDLQVGGRAEIKIGPDKAHWYHQFAETGATAHEIKGAPLAFLGNLGWVITGMVKHPGRPAAPFLRPAMVEVRDAVLREAGEVFRREIERLLE